MITRNRARRAAFALLLVAWLALACNTTSALPTYAPTLTPSATPTYTSTPTPLARATRAPTLTRSPTPTHTPTAKPTSTFTYTPSATSTATPTSTSTSTSTPLPPALTGVLIISVDGLRPEAAQLADAPNLDRLIGQGAVSWNARTVLPSVTLPGHASMLGGSSPEQHGVLWNDYEPERGYVPLPTLFSVAHDEGLTTAMFVGKKKLEHIAVPGTVDTFTYVTGGDAQVAGQAAYYLRQTPVTILFVLFVHLAGVDASGHLHGWLSSRQIEAVTRSDGAIGVLLDTLEEVGRLDKTLIIVTADHGGIGAGHGGGDAESMTIPWVIVGPGVRAGYEIEDEIRVYDTAATAAWALGLSLPPDWEGRPVVDAFLDGGN